MKRMKLSRRLPVWGAAATAGVVVAVLTGALPSAADPQGNNGTIKIDNVAFDDHPNNEPHVGCVFQVDFYGFDEGDFFAEVIFEAHPPTTRAGGNQVLLTDNVFIGEDSNAGGGSTAGLDASETYTLSFAGITPHPKQGFHVKLTIHADDPEGGADVKHKVFWVQDCPKPPPPKNGEGNGHENGDNGKDNGEENGVKESADTPVPVPTAVPAGSDSAGEGSAAPLGLILAGSTALAGTALVARRRFLHDS